MPLANIMLSEVIFGGVGAGMYGILIYVVLAVFIAGLMVGRTPEYLGKKIESYDVKMAMLVVLVFPLVILIFAAISCRVSRLRDIATATTPDRMGCRRFFTLSRPAPAITDRPLRGYRRTRSGTTRLLASRC